MSDFCILCGRPLEDSTCDRCECMLSSDAALVSVQAHAAEPKADTVTAKEFVEKGFAEKIKNGECIVTYCGDRIEDGNNIPLMDIKLIGNNGRFLDVLYPDGKVMAGVAYPTDLLRVTWLPVRQQPALATAGGEVTDEVTVLRAEIAHLRGVLTVIRDYPTVETDMELGHQVAGMAMQAEVALEDDPPRSGLLSILVGKNEALKAANERLSAQLAALEASKLAAEGLVEALKPFSDLYLDFVIYNFENDEDHQLNIVEYIDRYSDDEAMLNLFKNAHTAYVQAAATGQPAIGDGGQGAVSHEQ